VTAGEYQRCGEKQQPVTQYAAVITGQIMQQPDRAGRQRERELADRAAKRRL